MRACVCVACVCVPSTPQTTHQCAQNVLLGCKYTGICMGFAGEDLPAAVPADAFKTTCRSDQLSVLGQQQQVTRRCAATSTAVSHEGQSCISRLPCHLSMPPLWVWSSSTYRLFKPSLSCPCLSPSIPAASMPCAMPCVFCLLPSCAVNSPCAPRPAAALVPLLILVSSPPPAAQSPTPCVRR